jgi:hypothetical protein
VLSWMAGQIPSKRRRAQLIHTEDLCQRYSLRRERVRGDADPSLDVGQITVNRREPTEVQAEQQTLGAAWPSAKVCSISIPQKPS